MGCARSPERLSARRGVTLVELLVALAVLGVMAGVVGLTLRPGTWRADVASLQTDRGAVAAARRRALASGAPVTITVTVGDRAMPVTALPDGRVIGAEPFGVDPLTGLPAADTTDE